MPTNVKRSHSNVSFVPLEKKRKLEINEDYAHEAMPENSEGGSSTFQDVSSRPASSTLDANVSLNQWAVSEIIDGEVYYIPKFVDEETANQWLSELTRLDTWYHPKLKVYGKEVSQSRSIAAYCTDINLIVKYSGHVVTLHHKYPHLLTEIQKRLEGMLGETFNHVMLNRYGNGSEYIGKHRDTKENKVIVSLSLGAERMFIMTPNKSRRGSKAHRWKLANGSLLIMKGDTQDNWKHEIPKDPKVKDERISLTFRQLASS